MQIVVAVTWKGTSTMHAIAVKVQAAAMMKTEARKMSALTGPVLTRRVLVHVALNFWLMVHCWLWHAFIAVSGNVNRNLLQHIGA